MRARGRLAWVATAVWVLAACYPGMQPSHGSVQGITLGGESCSGLKQGAWSFPTRADHCWAFKASRGKPAPSTRSSWCR
jgi:hypothetical protein